MKNSLKNIEKLKKMPIFGNKNLQISTIYLFILSKNNFFKKLLMYNNNKIYQKNNNKKDLKCNFCKKMKINF